MPWDLVFPDGSRRRLYPGEFTIGRKEGECGIVCPDDKSISRLHATLRVEPLTTAGVSTPEEPPAAWVVDSSRFGTAVDGKPAAKAAPGTRLTDGCVLKLGTQTTEARVCYSPLVACAAALDGVAYAGAVPHAAALGVHLVRHWRDDCTLLLAPGAPGGAPRPACAAGACALLAGVPIISPSWLTAAAAAADPAVDPQTSLSAFAVPLGDATGAALVAAAFMSRRGTLLRGVRLLFGPPAGGAALPTHAALAAALAPADADLAAAVRAAGGAAAALRDDNGVVDEVFDAVFGSAADAVALADEAASGARGVLLVLPPTRGAARALATGPWARAAATDGGRVLACLLLGALGGLQAPGDADAMPPPPARRGGGAAAAAADGSDTDEDAAPPTGTASVAPSASAGGFVSFAGGRRARALAAAAAAGSAPPATAPAAAAAKSKAAGKRKAGGPPLPPGARAAAAAAEEEEPEPEPAFCGDVVVDELLVRPMRPTTAQPTAPAGPGSALPNFKRFRKVALLPSSTTFGMLVPYDAEGDPFAAEDLYAAETRAAALVDAQARADFERENGKSSKAKRPPAKPKAAKK